MLLILMGPDTLGESVWTQKKQVKCQILAHPWGVQGNILFCNENFWTIASIIGQVDAE